MTAEARKELGLLGWSVIVGVAIVFGGSVYWLVYGRTSTTQGLSQAQLERRAELFRDFWPPPPASYGGTRSGWYHARTQEVIGRSVSDWEELFSLADTHTQSGDDDGISWYHFWHGEVGWSQFHVIVVENGIITKAENGNISK